MQQRLDSDPSDERWMEGWNGLFGHRTLSLQSALLDSDSSDEG